MEALNVLDFFVLGCGFYALYAAFMLKRDGTIIKLFLLPKGLEETSCKDLQSFANYMSPKLWTLGLMMLGYAFVALMNDYLVRIMNLYWVMLIAFVAVLFWYGRELKKAIGLYF